MLRNRQTPKSFAENKMETEFIRYSLQFHLNQRGSGSNNLCNYLFISPPLKSSGNYSEVLDVCERDQ